MAKEAGWSARGLLAPLWKQWGGSEPFARERLAAAVKTSPSALSSINSGKRRLGHDLAPRLASVLGVSLLELGAPEEEADDRRGLTLRDRLQELAEAYVLLKKKTEMLEARLQQLEARRTPRRRTKTSP